MRRIISYTGVAAVLLGIAVGQAQAKTPAVHQAAGQFSVGLVTDIGGLNDKGFNHLAYVGLQRVITQYHMKGSVIQSHSQADYVPNLTNFASNHYNLTIGVGFLMQSAIYQVAKAYPNQKFALVDGQPQDPKGNPVNLPNVENLFFREQESGFLVGVMAGLMERNKVGVATHNVIGAAGGLSLPAVNRYIAGYIAGAHKVNPSVRILVGYCNTFTIPDKCKNLGTQHISQGADILFAVAGGAGLGYLAAAQQRGKYGIGVDADQGSLGSYVITSAIKKVDVAVAVTARETQLGHFRSGSHDFDLKNDATGFGKPSKYVPANIVQQVKLWASLIKSGRVVPPTAIKM